MLDGLIAEGPAPEHAEPMRQYGRFVGAWTTAIEYHSPDGQVRRVEGRWDFSYALEGRAVIDVWRAGGECGLCVRVWDPALRAWRFTYHGPVGRTQIQMFAQEIGEEIVQERDDGGVLVRWIFFDITDDRFRWRAVSSRDGGATWRLDQTVEARRVR